jgi:hypothetical protein
LLTKLDFGYHKTVHALAQTELIPMSMTPEELKDWMRIYAVEILSVNQLAVSCLAHSSDPLAMVETLRQQMVGGARTHAFPGLDPAMSDLASAELEDAMNRLMDMVRAQISEVLDNLQKKARGS